MPNCLVCFEYRRAKRIKSIMKTNCKCNYYVHHKCIKEWKQIKNHCLICSESFKKKDLYPLPPQVNNQARFYFFVFLILWIYKYQLFQFMLDNFIILQF